MFATIDEAFEDLAQTLAGIPDGEWVPPLVVWTGGVEGVVLSTVQARLKSKCAELWRAWQHKRRAFAATVRRAVEVGHREGKSDGTIASELGIQQRQVRYVRDHILRAKGNRSGFDWAAKVSGIPRGVRRMELHQFAGVVCTRYQTAYSALRQWRVPGWGLKNGMAVRMEVGK